MAKSTKNVEVPTSVNSTLIRTLTEALAACEASFGPVEEEYRRLLSQRESYTQAILKFEAIERGEFVEIPSEDGDMPVDSDHKLTTNALRSRIYEVLTAASVPVGPKQVVTELNAAGISERTLTIRVSNILRTSAKAGEDWVERVGHGKYQSQAPAEAPAEA